MHLHEIKKSKLALIGGLAVLAASVASVQAGDISQGFYLSTDPGLNLMTGIRGSSGGSGSNLRLDAGARWDIEAGYGFKLNDQWTLGVEAESGVIWNSFSSYENGYSETEVGGNAYQVPVLANAIVNYHIGKWTPYAGIGGGVDYISANIWSSDNHPTIFANDDIGPAVQAQAGVRYALSDKTEVGLGYKYLTAFSEKVGGDRLSELNNHTISLSFTVHF